MMSTIFKKIPGLFLWLAGLIIIAHLVIPHDHHISYTYPNQNDECPASNGKSGHSSGIPMHCHAFNDITTEKNKYLFFKNIHYQNIEFSNHTYTFDFELQITCISTIDFEKPIHNSYLLELSPLRAPPSII